MTPSKAIFAGAALIAATLIVTNAVHPAIALNNNIGPYMLMQHSNTAANAGVFRIDTMSGEVSYCYVTGTSGANVACSGYAK